MNNRLNELTQRLAPPTRRAALKRFGSGLPAIMVALLLANLGVSAAPSFTAIDYPGGSVTMLTDINVKGHMVGRYADTTGVTHGFLLKNGVFTDVTVPGAVFTRALGINRNGDIVGSHSLTGTDGHGFLLQRGVFFSIDFPGGISTLAQGINLNGDIVGAYQDWTGSKNQGNPTEHGFLLRAGVFTTIDFPGAQQTQLYRINDNGQIVGRYHGNGSWHLFRRIDGNFTAVDDVPWAVQTVPGISHLGGLNSRGDIVGIYSSVPFKDNDKALYGLRGFLLSAGLYTAIDFPDAVVTLAFGINDDGIVVGTYQNADGTIHGYLRAP